MSVPIAAKDDVSTTRFTHRPGRSRHTQRTLARGTILVLCSATPAGNARRRQDGVSAPTLGAAPSVVRSVGPNEFVAVAFPRARRLQRAATPGLARQRAHGRAHAVASAAVTMQCAQSRTARPTRARCSGGTIARLRPPFSGPFARRSRRIADIGRMPASNPVPVSPCSAALVAGSCAGDASPRHPTADSTADSRPGDARAARPTCSSRPWTRCCGPPLCAVRSRSFDRRVLPRKRACERLRHRRPGSCRTLY